ncbi:TLC domain-containing protein 2-like [Neocloeon triangulifer]|uniref:TLC domain-containing protein 2-like n=1 Tax=Neocloeon triangulifer TaxID=2078957 RepID=UPI00286F29AC|nr:TLC domain-containing protein 2-like [Neocloeon triangulifer]
MDPALVTGPNLGYAFAACSSLTFTAINLFLLANVVPKSARNTFSQQWKWRNTFNSLIHSVLTGIGALYCFWESPMLREDLINKYTSSSHLLISVSVGYFIYDFCDLLINHRKRSSYELLLHHTMVLMCFGLAVVTKHYLGYGIVALLVEVNSVFLHTRQLMLIQGISKNQLIYRINSMLNIGTFVVFRIATLGWMTRWLAIHKDELTMTAFTIGSVAMSVVMLMNIVLFLRVLVADLRSSQKSQEADPVAKKSN